MCLHNLQVHSRQPTLAPLVPQAVVEEAQLHFGGLLVGGSNQQTATSGRMLRNSHSLTHRHTYMYTLVLSHAMLTVYNTTITTTTGMFTFFKIGIIIYGSTVKERGIAILLIVNHQEKTKKEKEKKGQKILSS